MSEGLLIYRKRNLIMTNQDNAHIEKYLDYYLFNAESSNFSKDILMQRRKVDYAVLITGGWGSGKTYFIENYLNRKKIQLSKDIYEHPFEIIKISLFGISSEEEINQLIFEEMYKIIGKTAFKKVVNNSLKAVSVLCSCLELIPDPSPKMVSTKTVVGVFNNVATFAGDVLNEELKELKEHPRNIIVVFDDVERCAMPKPVLLGYLNRYVEYLHVPCILLADDRIWNEAERLQKDDSTLHSMASTQEKVIGARFKIKTRPETVIGDLLALNDSDKETVHEKCCLILQKFKNDFVEILNYFGVYNYRALKHTFVEFELFYSFFPKERECSPWEKDEMARAIVIDFVVTVYCHMLGVFKYDDEDIDRAFDDEWKMAMYMAEAKKKRSGESSTEEAEEKVKKIIEELKDKYEQAAMSLSLPFISKSYGDYSKKWYDIWKQWLKEESVDENKLRDVIENSIWFKLSNETQRNNMLRYAFLSKEDAAEAWKAFNDAINNNLITRPNEIFSFYHILLWYAENGLLPYSSDFFEKSMFDYLERVKDKLENEKLYSDSDIREYNSTYDAEKCKKFKEKLTLLVGEKYGKNVDQSLQKYLDMLISEEEGKRFKAEIVLSGDSTDERILLEESDAEIVIDFYRNHEVEQLKRIHPVFEKRFSRGIQSEVAFIKETLKQINVVFEKDKCGAPLPPNEWCLFYLKQVFVNAVENQKRKNQEIEEALKNLEDAPGEAGNQEKKSPE